MKKVKGMGILDLPVILCIVGIYFQIYWHYWFVKMLGGYVLNSLLPIIILLYILLIREFLSNGITRIKKRKTYYLFIPLFLYLFLASLSIFLNEQEVIDIKAYLIYIYSPALIFMGILGLYTYKRNENIKLLMMVIFFMGVIFSTYVAVTYSMDPEGISRLPVLETNRGEISADTGAAYGIGELGQIRYTIPGISSTTYGPLIVPLIFVGIYFRKYAAGILKHLYTILILFLSFCVLMTVSRGPLIILAAGMAYLLYWKWFKVQEVIVVLLFLFISALTFAKMSFLRLLITFIAMTPFKFSLYGNELSGITQDPRLMSIKGTLLYIYQHPFWGMGMTNLIKAQQLSYGKEHNNFLSIAATFGIPSLIFYILFIVLLFVMLHHKIKKLSENPVLKDMGIVLNAGLLAFILYLNASPAEFHFIWVWFGLSAAWIRNCEKDFSAMRIMP